MTKKHFEKIGKSLLLELPGFAVKGQLLFIHPVHQTLRAIFFDRSIDARGFYAQVLVQPLFVPASHLGFNFGWRLNGGSHLWKADAPNLITELRDAIKREALPLLSRLNSPRDIADEAMSFQKSQDPYIQQIIAYSFARVGDVDKAVVAFDQLLHLLDLKELYPWQREIAERARALKAKLLVDPAGARRQFEAWEAGTAKNLGLENIR